MILKGARIWKTGKGSLVVTIPKPNAEKHDLKVDDRIDLQIKKAK